MTVEAFRELLLKLADLHDNAGSDEHAEGLRTFAQLFDGQRNQTVAKFMEQVRTIREL